MLTLKMLRDDPKGVIEKLKIKNFDAQPIVDKVLELDARRRSLQTESSAELLARMDEAAAELENQLVLMPNTPCALVKPGKGAEDNEVVKMGGPEVKLPEGALPHWELARKYDIIDFDLGVKITGAGFPVYKGKGAKLQRALINFFLDYNTAAGYKEVEPPVMVNRDSGFGTGQLPDKEGQMYHANLDDFYMVPTAEVPVTNIFRDVILAPGEIPQRLTAYTPCFRREAGSYGKDVRGLNRLHQFDKVEIVRVEKPEDSYKALDDMVAHVESLVNKLGLKYRILDDNIGYLRYESFAYGVGESSLDEALSRLAACRALIIDIRENGGGQLTNASKLAARFCQQRTLVGYTQHKTGTGHSDFSAMSPIWLEPSARMRWHKRVALLTNRHVFSAANEFTMYMKELPLVTIVGDHTGGGAGMPFSSSLPNGWSVRFSAVPTYDARMQSIEFGIEPDHNVSLDIYDFFRGKDTLIEFARKLLVQ